MSYSRKRTYTNTSKRKSYSRNTPYKKDGLDTYTYKGVEKGLTHNVTGRSYNAPRYGSPRKFYGKTYRKKLNRYLGSDFDPDID